VIRTLDAGGDKNIPYLKIAKEENPFLGYRAIRYCLDNPEIFKTQISAILRAGLHGNVELMIPMIASIDELRRTKVIIAEVQNELRETGIEYSKTVRIGIMVETPAAALMVERLAMEVDFFSIGTNDLTQYLFAADRMNQKVANLNSYFHPALLKIVKYICESAHKNKIEADICGQAGEVPALVPIWVAMGIDNLSVSIPSILKVRKLICETDKAKAIEIMESALSLDTAQEVEDYLKSQTG
jgi:phosphotransferase system enzyme I (PtsI)